MTSPAFINAIRHLIASLVLLPGFAFATTIISDPLGDVASGPDIVSMSGAYDAASVYFTVAFAPGTLDINSFNLGISLDPDLNPSTPNIQLTIFRGFGFVFGFTHLAGPGVPSGGLLFPVSFDVDSISVAIPLFFLGGDDGVLLFSASASAPEPFVILGNPQGAPLPVDTIAAGAPTTPIDAPITAYLMLAALPGMLLARRRSG